MKESKKIAHLAWQLILAHAICDGALQTAYMARFKSPIADDPSGATIWWVVLLSHALVNGAGVYIVTRSISLSIIEVVGHFFIDLTSGLRLIGMFADQALHMLVKFVIFVLKVRRMKYSNRGGIR